MTLCIALCDDDQLKKHATAIIDSNENDGVANWLIKNFK